MLGFITHVARWVFWHAEGVTIGDEQSRPHAQITILSSTAERQQA